MTSLGNFDITTWNLFKSLIFCGLITHCGINHTLRQYFQKSGILDFITAEYTSTALPGLGFGFSFPSGILKEYAECCRALDAALSTHADDRGTAPVVFPPRTWNKLFIPHYLKTSEVTNVNMTFMGSNTIRYHCSIVVLLVQNDKLKS